MLSKWGNILKNQKRTVVMLLLAGLCSFCDGPLMADTLVIGDSSSASYNNYSTHNITGTLVLGNQASGSGTYTLTGDSSQTNINFASGGNGPGNPNGALIVGNGGTGSFTQGTDLTDNNNQVNVAGDLTLGQQPNSVGTYILNSGTLNVGSQLAVGGQSTGNNVFTQNGGALNLTGTASNPINPDYVPIGGAGFAPWGGTLSIGGGTGNGDGSNSGGNGTYNLIAGSINSTNNIQIGSSGTGIMNQSGGSVSTVYMAEGFSGTGTYNLSGGTINSYSENVGYAGTGIFNQSGGTHTISSSLSVGLQYASNSPGQGTYNLTGGTLSTGDTIVGSGEVGKFVISDTNGPSNHIVGGSLVLGNYGTYTITGNMARTNIISH